jgi:hypothetical protein
MDRTQPLPDPIEQFLEGPPRVAADSPFQDHLLHETLKCWRRQRRRRPVAVIAGLAASFLAGAICVHLWPLRTPDRGQEERVRVPDKSASEVAHKPAEKKVAPVSGGDAVAVEWNAFDEPNRREVLYRQAGDLYVQETHDYEAALRCYAQALESSSDQDLTITPDDNWLIMALKEARRKEQSHAKKDS